MNNKRFKFMLVGNYEDNEDVKFAAMIEQMEAIHEGLIALDRDTIKDGKDHVYYRVTSLKHDSPATVELEAVPFDPDVNIGEAVISRFISGWEMVAAGHRLPEDFPEDAKRSFRKIAGMSGKIERVVFISNGTRVEVTPTILERLDFVEKPTREAYGTVKGRIDSINVHGRNQFRIYPEVGPSFVICYFPEALWSEVHVGLRHYVIVSGKVRYRHDSSDPAEILVSKVRVLKDDTELPPLSGLWGLAPDFTGGMSTDEFLERQRRDDW